MKKTIIAFALTLATITSYCQKTKTSEYVMENSTPVSVVDSTPTYYFKLEQINQQIIAEIADKVYKKGWDNTNLVDIFNYLLQSLEQRKQYFNTPAKK